MSEDINITISEVASDVNITLEDNSEDVNISFVDNVYGTDFDSLNDTPSTKVGSALKLVRVSSDEATLEYIDPEVIESIEWGEIEGTVSNQTDLQAELDLKYNSISFNTDFDTRLNTKTTDNITEGTTNKYDKIVSLTEGTGIGITGSYPDFTISNTLTSAEWGNITGTITNQTDLIVELDLKTNEISFQSHITDANIHYPQSSINITESQISDLDKYTQVEVDHLLNLKTNLTTFNSHINDVDIHFEQGDINITASQVSNFDTEVRNNSSVVNNTTHRGLTNNPHTVTKTQVGLSNVANLDTTNASNITTGTLPSSVLPPVALTSVQVASSEAEQLALTTEEGDVVVRSDENKSYMRNSGTCEW